MLKRKLARESGPYWVEIESDSMETKEMVGLLEEMVQEVKTTVNDPSFEQIVDEVPVIAPNTSLTDGIMQILESRYGLRPRTLGEIRKVLEDNNLYFPATTVSSILISLWKRGRIRRWERNGKFVHQKTGS